MKIIRRFVLGTDAEAATRIVAALALSLTGGIATARAEPAGLVTEHAMVASPQPGEEIYVRNKHPAGMVHFRPDRTLVFVQGATYPASTSFDLELDGLSWMYFMSHRGFDLYLLDLPGHRHSTRPASMDQPPEDGRPIETTAQ